MRKECKIIQDLLPNYLENITTEETNNFIKEHLQNCEECMKAYNTMKENLEVKPMDTKEEISYMKKFKRKLKLLKNILLIIIVIFIVIVGRKAIILANLFNTSNELYDRNNYETIQIGERASQPNDLNNYYFRSVITYDNGNVSLLEEYRKDGKGLVTCKTFNVYDRDTYIKETWYSDGKEGLSFAENFKEDKVIIREASILQGGVPQVPSLKDGYWDIYFEYLLFADIYKTNLNGKECYVIRINNIEQYVDKESGMIIKVIDNNCNITTDNYYEFGNVVEDDVKRPDLPNDS